MADLPGKAHTGFTSGAQAPHASDRSQPCDLAAYRRPRIVPEHSVALQLNLLLSALSGGGRTTRHGDLIVVTMPASAFATTAQEFQQVQTWARARASLGNSHRDREAFVGRFQTVLARSGSGIATRGSRPVLARLLAGLSQAGMQPGEWSVPHDIHESMEVKRRPRKVDPADAPRTEADAGAVDNEPADPT